MGNQQREIEEALLTATQTTGKIHSAQQVQEDPGLNVSPAEPSTQAEDVSLRDQWPVRSSSIATDSRHQPDSSPTIPLQQLGTREESSSAASNMNVLSETRPVRQPLGPLNLHTPHRSLPTQTTAFELPTAVENLNPQRNLPESRHRRTPPNSRPKTRCRYGPLRNRKKTTEATVTQRLSPTSAAPDNNPASAPQTAAYGATKKSRPKVRCTFGPKVRAVQEPPGHTDLPSTQQVNEDSAYNPYLDPESDELDALLREIDTERKDSDPSQSYNSARHIPRSQKTAHTWEEGEETPATDPPLSGRRSQHGTKRQQPGVSDAVEPPESEENQLVRLPDRATLAPTRWDHIPRRQRDPNLTDEEFDVLLTREINDNLYRLRAESRLRQTFPPPPAATHPYSRGLFAPVQCYRSPFLPGSLRSLPVGCRTGASTI